MKQLFVRRGKNTAGPLTVAQFKEAVANGKLVGADQFAEASDGPWYPVAKVPFLPKPSGDTAATHLLADTENEPGQREQEPDREPQLLPQESQTFQGEGGASQAEQQARFDDLVDEINLAPLEENYVSGRIARQLSAGDEQPSTPRSPMAPGRHAPADSILQQIVQRWPQLPKEVQEQVRVLMNIDVPAAVVQSEGDVQVDCPYCETLLELSPDHSSQREGFQCSACEGVFEVDWTTGNIHYNTDSEATDKTLETVKKIASIGWEIFGALG